MQSSIDFDWCTLASAMEWTSVACTLLPLMERFDLLAICAFFSLLVKQLVFEFSFFHLLFLDNLIPNSIFLSCSNGTENIQATFLPMSLLFCSYPSTMRRTTFFPAHKSPIDPILSLDLSYSAYLHCANNAFYLSFDFEYRHAINSFLNSHCYFIDRFDGNESSHTLCCTLQRHPATARVHAHLTAVTALK